MISKDKRFIFIHVPKTGGTSIEKSLEKHSTDKVFLSGGNTVVVNNEYQKRLNLNRAQYKHISLKQYSELVNLSEYTAFCVIRNPLDRIVSLSFWGKKCWDENTMRKEIVNDKLISSNCMSRYICIDGELKVDYFLDFDNLKSDFKKMCDKLEIEDGKLGMLNVRKNKNKPNVSDDFKKFLREQFKTEFEFYEKMKNENFKRIQ